MPLYSEVSLIGDFFKLHHIENPGMAFGINFDYKYTKLILTLFRLFASIIIGFYLYGLILKNVNTKLLLFGVITGPPQLKEYPVEPVGVAMIKPSAQ